MSTFVVPAALGSALAAATSSVLQHRSARTAPVAGRAAGRLLGHLVTRPVWLAGLVAGAAGLVLHALALSGGRLAVVQPLLVSGMLFALPVSVVLEGRRPSPVAWLWALVLVGGLAAFLLAGRPSAGRVAADTDVLAIATIAGSATMALIGFAGHRWSRRHAAPLLGLAAGIGYGIVAALMKQTTAVALRGLVALVTTWPVYGLAAVGAVTLAVTQLAYRAGPLAQSLPALTVVDPAASVAVGAAVFHERLAQTPGALAVEVIGFALMAGASVVLARYES
jgi:drug/metabolite transporter (DMT)-like permease